jgi:hypothetical protein
MEGRNRAAARQKNYWQAMILLACLALGAATLFSML